MEKTNTLAYYDTATITAVKSFIVQATGPYPIKPFTVVIYEFSISLSVCPWQAFQPSLMFVGKAGAYLSEEPFRCSTLG